MIPLGLLSHLATPRGPGLPPKHPLPVALGHHHQLGAEFGAKSPQCSITSPPRPVCLPANGHSAQPGCLGPSASVPLRLCPESLQYSRTRVNMYSLCPNSTQSLCLAEGRREARRLLCTFNKQLSHRAPRGRSWGEDAVGWGCRPGSTCHRRSRAAGLTQGAHSGGAQGEWTLAGRKEAPTETWPVQELSFPFWEEGKILRAAYLGSEAILGSLPVTSSSGSNPGAKAEPWTPSAGVPWPDPAAQASHGPPLTTKPGKGQF